MGGPETRLATATTRTFETASDVTCRRSNLQTILSRGFRDVIASLRDLDQVCDFGLIWRGLKGLIWQGLSPPAMGRRPPRALDPYQEVQAIFEKPRAAQNFLGLPNQIFNATIKNACFEGYTSALQGRPKGIEKVPASSFRLTGTSGLHAFLSAGRHI